MSIWRTIAASVAGSSHLERGISCQDAHAWSVITVGEDEVLLASVADGAGSARMSETGARLATEHMLIELKEILEVLPSPAHFTVEMFQSAWEATRATLLDHAMTEGLQAGEFACTLLSAVALPTELFVGQIGDGAVVVSGPSGTVPVIWPQQGEYANETNFITGDRWREHLELRHVTEAIDSMCMFTDGLQRLALRSSSREADRGFLVPIFRAVIEAEDLATLEVQLAEFLSSQRIRDRTDDDATLLVATRTSCRPQ